MRRRSLHPARRRPATRRGRRSADCSQAASDIDFARCSSTPIVDTRLSRRARRLSASSEYVGWCTSDTRARASSSRMSVFRSRTRQHRSAINASSRSSPAAPERDIFCIACLNLKRSLAETLASLLTEQAECQDGGMRRLARYGRQVDGVPKGGNRIHKQDNLKFRLGQGSVVRLSGILGGGIRAVPRSFGPHTARAITIAPDRMRIPPAA